MSSPPREGHSARHRREALRHDRPELSVVVSTIGRPESITRVAEAVLADAATGEMIVVIDGPDPETEHALAGIVARDRRLLLLPSAHRGHLGALEEGVRIARGDVVVLLDDDVVPAPGTIGGHLAHHRGRSGIVVAGPMPVSVLSGTAPSVGTLLYADAYLRHLQLLETGVPLLEMLWGGNLSMRRSDCLGVGLQSPRFGDCYHEDRDLGFRLSAAGLVGIHDPALSAVHLHTRTDTEFLRDAARDGEGHVALHRAHPRLGPFRLRMLVDDLPAPLGAAVVVTGRSAHAGTMSSAVLRAGRVVSSLFGRHRTLDLAHLDRRDPEVVAARVVRRVMQCHGAHRALVVARHGGAETAQLVVQRPQT